jgi:sec-independent protein translocase protein TatC
MAKRKRSLSPSDYTMSLGDHLEELRARLILAILGLCIGAAVSLIFGKYILGFIEKPYTAAMKARQAATEAPQVESETTAFVKAFFDTLAARLDPNAPQIDPNAVSFLRGVSVDAVNAWTETMKVADGNEPLSSEYQLRVFGPAEAFVSYMKISFIAGLILTSPWVFYQIWMFVAAGLYEKERKYVRTAIPFSAALFVTGALFFLFGIAPYTLKFFLSFGDAIGVTSNWTLQRYVSFVTTLMLVFGIAFQTPIAIFILVRTGLVSIAALRRTRKYVILGMAFLAAVATPPDVISMISLLIPLYALYELGIILSIFAQKKTDSGVQAPAP